MAAPIELPSNIVLQGQGPVTILRVVDNADDSILTSVLVNDDPLSGNVDITIADLAIDGNKANQPPVGLKHGISLTFVENATIQRVVIHNMEQSGIALWDFCEEGLIEGCVIHDNDGSGMHLFSCFDMSVTGNRILRNGGDGILLLFGGSYTVVSNTILQNGSVGINITSESNSITGNTVEMNGSYGINLSAVQARNNTVSSNTVTRNGWYGIILSGGAHDNVVADNNIEQNGTDGANTYDNIFVVGGAEDNDIQGNVCRNGLTGQVRYGIAVDATAGDRNLVTNNDLLNSGVSGDLFIGNPTTITEAGNRLTFGSATGIAFRWMHSTDQAIAAGTNVLQWDTEIVDTAGVHSGAAETEYTVPINGIWHFLASIRIKELANSFSVSYRFRIKVNANTIVEQYVSGIFTTDNFPHSMVELVDYGAEEIGICEPWRRLFWVRLQVKGAELGRTLLVANAHYTWDGHDCIQTRGTGLRVDMAKRTLDTLERLRLPDEPVIFMGDLNESRAAIHTLRAGGLRDSVGTDGSPLQHTYPADPRTTAYRGIIDWQFHAGPIKVIESGPVDFFLDGVVPSDHKPVLVRYHM